MTSRPDTELLIPVVVGSVCVGHILVRGIGGFEAFTRDDKTIGTFRTREEAVGALMKGRS